MRRYCDDETGKRDRLTGASVDITGRERAEESLKQNEERLRLVLEASSEGVWDWNIQSGQAYFSPRYSEMLGYTTEEFVKDYSSWKALVHPDDFKRVHQAHMQHIRKGQEFCVEFRMRKKTGDWCWIRSRGMIVERDSKGGALRMVGTHLDITARKQAEDRAQESEGRFLLMANSAPVFIWAAGTDKLCTFVNEPWLKFTGRTLEQELGEGWAEGIHPDDRDRCLKVYAESFDARRPCTIEYRLRRSDGQYRWVSDHGVARYDSAQNFAGYIGSVVDVTERKQAEAEAQQSRQELAHAGRVTTLGELAGSFAHELSQPLTAILSNAQAAQQILSTAAPDLNETRLILEDIIAQQRHAGGIILRMRAMMKKRRAQLLPLDMEALVREVLRLIRSELLVRNVTVITDMAPRLPLVRGDRVQLQQVVLNLVMNACDALKTKPGSNHAVTVQAKRLEVGQVQVAVSDRGPGFSPEMLERPFEPFRTTKPHGLGLGLPICRSIIGAHNGRLWLANNGDGGATVSFALPMHQKETP
jgi:PAS domain S-box-containing protein